MPLEFKLEVFEGPLDLMLHLISKHKLNIFDIEISTLLEQFLGYIDELSQNDMEVTADFLEMAARLIYIKTMSLLPRHEQAEELKKELEGVLIEYALCKKVALRLRGMYTGHDIFTRSPAQILPDKSYNNIHQAEELWAAYISLSGKERRNEPVNPVVFEPLVSGRYVTVFSKIVFVLKNIYRHGYAEIRTLYKNLESSERVAVFLAILELAKSGRIQISADNTTINFARK